MSYIYNDNLAYLNGESDAPLAELQYSKSSAATSGGAPSGAAAAAAPAASAQSSGAPGESAPVSALSAPAQSQYDPSQPFYERLFQPLESGIQAGQQGLSEAESAFYGAAGQSRTFGGIGGRQQLREGLQPGASTTGLEGLVNAQYQGPAGLSGGDGFYADPNLRGQGQAYQTGSGLASLAQQVTPGLTPGMARQEAQTTWKDPNFRARRDDTLGGLESFYGQIEAANQKAQGFAGQRGREEERIRDKSRDFLTQRQEDITGRVQEHVGALNEQNQQALVDWKRFLENPSASLRASENPEYRALFTDSTLDERNRAGRAIERIGVKYQDIKDIPPAIRMPSGRGIDAMYFQLGGELYSLGHARAGKAWGQSGAAQMPAGMTPEQLKEIALQVDRRQGEIDKFFGSPVNLAAGQKGERGLWHSSMGADERGSLSELYSAQFPYLYQNEPLPDITQFAQFVKGNKANFENTVTDKQVEQLNKISDLLATGQQVQRQDPFRASQMVIQVRDFLDAEEKVLADRKGKLTATEQAYKKQLRAVRSRYNESRDDWIGDALGISSVFLPFLAPSLLPAGAAMTRNRGEGTRPSAFGSPLSEVRI